jgi:SM-20-related protein
MPTSAAPVMIIDDFLGGAEAERLLRYAIANESGFQTSKVALWSEGIVDKSRRVSRVSADVDAVMPSIEPAIRKAVDAAIPKLGLVNVDSYRLEPELAWSGDGGFFQMHTDTLRYRTSHRVMTTVYYFHRQPKAFTGGQLHLYGLGGQADSDACHEIEPRFDRMVFFPSWFPHEVLPVRCNTGAFANGRFAITCWVHKTQERSP